MATSQPRRQSHCLPIGVNYASVVLLRGGRVGVAKGKTQTKLKLREQVTTLFQGYLGLISLILSLLVFQEKGSEEVFMSYLKSICQSCVRHGRTLQFWANSLHGQPEQLWNLPPGVIAMEYGNTVHLMIYSFSLVGISTSFGGNLYANCHSCVIGSSI